MIREDLIITNKLGLHTRAAAKLVDTAKRYASKIELVFRDRAVDCKSIMSIITLGAQYGNTVTFIVTGDDEQDALSAISHLLDGKFGEE